MSESTMTLDEVTASMDAEEKKYPVLKYFRYSHLPPHLQERAKPYADLAYTMSRELPQGAEVAVGLRKLLEAKDCFVRSALVTASNPAGVPTKF